ncbi:MAG: RNA polymerase subunit sigma-70 [Thalassobius sp.]|nr:RNA polymerase subunit sigma-70 [Thalassovita sp.]
MDSENQTDHFLESLEKHKGIIYKIANAYCKNDEDRKDLIQEIITQLWKSHSRYNNEYKFSTWVYRIALNVSISFYSQYKKRANIHHRLNLESIQLVHEESPRPDENLQQLQRFISELKELDKALILLYLDQKSHNEIAEILGISTSNVATKIARIKMKLKDRFSKIKKD